MESSDAFKAATSPVPSPDGLHIASIAGSRIHIRSSTSMNVFRIINLPASVNEKNVTLRWSRRSVSQQWCYRFLIFDGDSVRVWDLRDARWTVAINNGSGGMGKVVSAEFGFSMDEVMVFSDFGSKMTVWSLRTGRSIEVKNPKFASGRGFAFRPAQEGAARVMALLTRSGAQDIITLHVPNSFRVMRTITLATQDAQGLKWSPDGKWLAIWDTPSAGTKIFIYSADGHLYRVYGGEIGNDAELGLGVRSMEWGPDSQCLAVGGHGRRAVMLSTRTFSPSLYLEHTPSIQIEEGHIWQELVSASTKREYTAAAQPITPPLAAASTATDLSRCGISTLAFNADGTLVATRDDAVPTAVWIWEHKTMRPRTVLLQHSPVKKLMWHPSRSDLLLVQCAIEKPVAFLWSALSDSPMILPAPLQPAAKIDIQWLPTKQDRKPGILVFGNADAVVLWPDGRDAEEEARIDESADDEIEHSLDSVVEMLAGRTPLRRDVESTMFGETEEADFTTGSFDDTFRGRGPVSVA